MSVIVFLVDTSASMNQSTYSESGRQTFIDIAKKCVELFIKERKKYFASSRDKYMLLTFDDPPDNIKSTCKENVKIFLEKLHLLEATSMSTIKSSLRNAFDTLNLLRISTGVDFYGHGRIPFSLQTATIILITHGGKLSTPKGISIDLTMPKSSKLPGSSHSKVIYRWDQRLFAVVLRLPGTFTSSKEEDILPPCDDNNINYLCEKTGGRSFSIKSQNMILRSIQYIVFNIHNGFYCRFEKVRPNIVDSSKLVHISRVPEQRNRLGIWPIPETYLPHLQLNSLPPREGHPIIKYCRIYNEPEIIDGFPIDEYNIDECKLTKFMLSCANPVAFWNVFIEERNNDEPGGFSLFGFLKADKNSNTIKLNILCYNYPVFIGLLKSLLIIKDNPTAEWSYNFNSFLQTVPGYYIKPIRMCLRILNIEDAVIESIIPTNAHIYLQPSILELQMTERIQAKELLEEMHKQIQGPDIFDETKKTMSVTAVLDKDKLIPPFLKDKEFQFTDFVDFQIETEPNRVKNEQFTCDLPNVPRHQLLDHMRNIVYKFFNYTGIESIDEDIRHNVPIGEMSQTDCYGNRKSPKLREINPVPERKNKFGSPFVLKKTDHEEITDFGCPPFSPKRGALPLDLEYKRPLFLTSPPPSPKRMRRNISDQPSTSYFSIEENLESKCTTITFTSSDDTSNIPIHQENEETIDVFSQLHETDIEIIEVSVSPISVLQNLENGDVGDDLSTLVDEDEIVDNVSRLIIDDVDSEDDVSRLVIDENSSIDDTNQMEH